MIMRSLAKYSLVASAMIVLWGLGLPAHAALSSADQATSLVSITPVSTQAIEKQDYQKLVQNKISASRAKSIARRYVGGGEVVDISRTASTYRVRVIAKDGRVVDVYIDANTGRVKN